MFNAVRIKDVNISDYLGRSIVCKGLLSEVKVRLAKNGSEYMQVVISDRDIKVNAKIWGVTDKIKKEMAAGRVYEYTLSIEAWGGNPSAVIKGYKELDESTVDYVDRIKDVERYLSIFKGAMECVDKETVYYKILHEMVTDDVLNEMSVHAAALNQHHNIIGGLLLHTATMLNAGYAMCQVYTDLNRNLVLTAIAIHDIMKLKELSCNALNGEISYTVHGSLIGHITMCAVEIDRVAEKLGMQDMEEVELLKHTVLSHHGKKEWGSPVEPAIPEALLVHYIDSLDAEMYKMVHMIAKVESGNTYYENGKTYYHKADTEVKQSDEKANCDCKNEANVSEKTEDDSEDVVDIQYTDDDGHGTVNFDDLEL